MLFTADGFRRAIRRRPALFIGDTAVSGKSRFVESLLMLGVMGARDSRLREVSATLASDGACSVAFDGLPWPTTQGVSPFAELESWLTFANVDMAAGPPPGMPHGIFLQTPCIDLGLLNALSSPLDVIAWSGEQTWRRTFREGLPVESPLDTAPDRVPPSSGAGLRVTLTPDPSIFDPPPGFSWAWLTERLSALSALAPATSWRLRDEASGADVFFRREHGLAGLCAERSASSRPLHEPWVFTGRAGATDVDLALQWVEDPASASILSWANHEPSPRRGSHHAGLFRGLRTALRTRRETLGLPPVSRAFSDTALSERLTVVMSISSSSIVWRGSLMHPLEAPKVRSDVSKLVRDWMKQTLASHPKVESELFTLLGVSPS
ncbi:DNA gyrase subunit B [Myxococcus landrumensis]|uniref:DNA topoisomerase (ATP-hydrolyzing) n=1 Tax=Myxococcus landrumensis TaxID=2813577 RepID=A0ABX7N1Q3_9BACT|nr:DNA gyrase subunit B [Myxococcus landrumus]QSQ12354.1 DNA gyrase subunit B [Myxococcus landrumus]